MDWEDFERLLLDLGRDELGLRSLSFFGKRGQAQKGLDVIGTNAEGKPEGIQSKRYQAFSVTDLDAAVEKYTQSPLPFRLVRFVIGVAAKVDDRAVVERKIVLNEAHHPLEIDIWDQSRISEMLRDKPETVLKYFGARAAERFCVPHVLTPIEVAGPDSVATADAVMLGPLKSADAVGLLTQAARTANDDPAGALPLYREVQGRLVSSGFPGHATEFDDTVAELHIRVGAEAAAIRLLMDALWAAERADDSLRADHIARTLRSLAGFPEFGPIGTTSPRTPTLGAAYAVAQFVADHLHAPVPISIELPSTEIALSEAEDRARVTLFSAERALGNDDLAWIITHRDQIDSAAAEMATTHFDVEIRLRLTVADAAGEWAPLIQRARTGMQREFKALVLARHARYQALDAAYAEADDEWNEAIGEACLAQRYDDAADWLYSQRYIANRYRPTFVDKWHPVAQALSNRPSRPRIISTASKSRERALSALHYGKPREAAIKLRRQLLDGLRAASLHDEIEACRLLGQTYRETGAFRLAANYSIRGGDPEGARSAAAALGDNYEDIADLLKGPLSWVVASALEFATAQADLVPNNELDTIVELAFGVIRDVTSGSRHDSPLFSPHMYLCAYGLLAALADRLSTAHAQTVLEMLADSVVVESEHHYHRTDESHIEIAAGIGSAHNGALRDSALDQLVGLFERDAHPFGAVARRALTDNIDRVGTRLQEMAERGHNEAAALLGYIDPARVSPAAAQDAAERLRQPTNNGPTQFRSGTGAVNDSLIAAVLPAEVRIECVEMLISNARSPWEGSGDRNDFLLAASNLVNGLDEEHRRRFLDDAIDFAAYPPLSQVDVFNASMSSPLSAMRIDDRTDCRPAAAFLAARLAVASEEKRLVRDTALRLIGTNNDEDYRVTKTLQLVQTELADNIGMLAHGRWPLRCLAAILWADASDASEELGMTLARDPDVRVRRALATEIVATDDQRTADVRTVLRNDPRWSVRSVAGDDFRRGSR